MQRGLEISPSTPLPNSVASKTPPRLGESIRYGAGLKGRYFSSMMQGLKGRYFSSMMQGLKGRYFSSMMQGLKGTYFSSMMRGLKGNTSARWCGG